MGRALVTGATGGIGSALVAALTYGGHEVIALGRRPASLDEEAARGVRPLAVDLREPEQIAEVVGQLDGLDALIHCAGISEVAPVPTPGPPCGRRP